MSPLRVLLLGGTGVLSSATAHVLADRGADVTAVTRGRPTPRPLPPAVRHLTADARDPRALAAALDGTPRYDAVVDFIAYRPDDIADAARVLADRTGHYVFVSTGSVYARPAPHLPLTESSARRASPAFDYPRAKLACEDAVERAYRDGLPATIVRAAHVYDRTTVPLLAGWTAVDRWRAGKPAIVHGDGTSLWNLLHARDFAAGLTGLLGDHRTVGEAVHITSDQILTWNAIHETLARAAGARPLLVHRTSADIGREIDWMGPVLTEDFRHSVLYDNSKIRRLVPGFHPEIPFDTGAREILAWFDEDAARRRTDPQLDAAFDRLAQDPAGGRKERGRDE